MRFFLDFSLAHSIALIKVFSPPDINPIKSFGDALNDPYRITYLYFLRFVQQCQQLFTNLGK